MLQLSPKLMDCYAEVFQELYLEWVTSVECLVLCKPIYRIAYMPTPYSNKRKMPSKVKSSVYIDGEIWRRFKKYAAEQEREASVLLEELMREELMLNLQDALEELTEQEGIELDFEPVKPITGLVSTLVREMRDERNSLSGH